MSDDLIIPLVVLWNATVVVLSGLIVGALAHWLIAWRRAGLRRDLLFGVCGAAGSVAAVCVLLFLVSDSWSQFALFLYLGSFYGVGFTTAIVACGGALVALVIQQVKGTARRPFH
jgi:hypothetical protein